MEEFTTQRSFPAWEIMAVNGQDCRVDFWHTGWQQTEAKCPKCKGILESTRLVLNGKIKIQIIGANNHINPDSEEGKKIKKKLASSLEKRCLNCWHRKKRKKIREQQTPSTPTFAQKGFLF